MTWAEAWIGKAYAPLGRGPVAYDCLGLFIEVQARQFGRVLDYGLVRVGEDELDACARHIGEWRPVKVAVAGDAVLMRRGRGWHLGVALDDRLMLHAHEPQSVIEDFRASRWGARLDGVYRYHAV